MRARAGGPPRLGLLRRAVRGPVVRLLVLGAALVVVLRLLPAPREAAAPPAATLAAGPALDGPASDEEILFRAGSSAVAADDPVVRARLLKLARYLELGGTAEESDDDLVASAQALGLARDDVVLRRYLVEAARLALARPAAVDLPDEAELRAYYQRNAARFTTPARVRASQVYLSAARRGGALADDAARLLEDLRRRGVEPAMAATEGDPFVRGSAVAGSHAAVARGFGAGFTAALQTLPAGGWQGPIASPYGLHLVWIDERTPARLEPLERVRGRVVHQLLRERGEQRARARLDALRSGHGATAGRALVSG